MQKQKGIQNSWHLLILTVLHGNFFVIVECGFLSDISDAEYFSYFIDFFSKQIILSIFSLLTFLTLVEFMMYKCKMYNVLCREYTYTEGNVSNKSSLSIHSCMFGQPSRLNDSCEFKQQCLCHRKHRLQTLSGSFSKWQLSKWNKFHK